MLSPARGSSSSTISIQAPARSGGIRRVLRHPRKVNTRYHRRYSRPVDKTTGLGCDQTVVLTGADSKSRYPQPLRRVKYRDESTGKTFNFLTNNFAIPALTVAELYAGYRETLRILIEKYRERSMFDRLVVAPTGSKMQAVAVALFRAALYDVFYPTPQIFTEPDRYTVGARRLYELDLPIQEIRRILS